MVLEEDSLVGAEGLGNLFAFDLGEDDAVEL
jgi:hypothetical protein